MPASLLPEYRALLCLVRAGLWQRPADDLSPFPLSAQQWRGVYRTAVRQTVTGIAFSGLSHLPERFLPDDALMVHWAAATDRVECRNRTMNAVLGQLLGRLHAHGFHPVVLKGQGVAAFYPQPLLRECGDIDLWFPSDAASCEAALLMRRAGCSPERQPDGSIVYFLQGIGVEHHTRLFDLHNPFLRRGIAALVQQHGWRMCGFADGVPGALASPGIRAFTVPSPLPTLLLLNAHLLKHLLAHGAGLRQFCDMAVAYHALRGTYEPRELAAVYRRCGLRRWSDRLHGFMVQYLGLDAATLPDAVPAGVPADDLLQIVFDGGNFGHYGTAAGHGRPQQPWRRKWHTLLAFWKRRETTAALARGEMFWTLAVLAAGNAGRLFRRRGRRL